jgi:hypothetical protein
MTDTMTIENSDNSAAEVISADTSAESTDTTDTTAEEIVYKDEDFEQLKYYPNYEISKSNGPIWIIRNIKTKKDLKPSISRNGTGYIRYGLYRNGKKKNEDLHRIVARQFLDFDPENKHKKLVIDHLDNNRLNNSIDNLQILTNSQNILKNPPYWKIKQAKLEEK